MYEVGRDPLGAKTAANQGRELDVVLDNQHAHPPSLPRLDETKMSGA